MEFGDSLFTQPLRLTYSLHSKTMMESIQSCQRRLCYTDVQLISDGGTVFAHSIVLAGASSFLKQLLTSNPDPTIVIHLPGVDYEPLRLLLEVLYGGEELQLTLKQVVALQDLGSLLHIDMCNSAAMEQAFLQASQEGVLSIPSSLQHSTDPVAYSNESSPAPTPLPPPPEVTRKNGRSGSSPNKVTGVNNNNNNNNNNNTPASKKRKTVPQHSSTPVAPFSLLANVTSSKMGKRGLADEDLENLMDPDEELMLTPQPAAVTHKKPSRAALKETVTCRECHTPFKSIMQLNVHMTREGHLFPPCPECSTVFITLESLMAHVDVHSPETVFTCKYCQKGVLGHDRYLYHMLMCKSLIRGDYVCFICRKAFRNSGSLKTHLLLHTGAKPFPCTYCSASFRQRHHRSHHERSVHLMLSCTDASAAEPTPPLEGSAPAEVAPSNTEGMRPFPCGHCNAAFRQSNHRSYHERVIHGVDRRTRQPKGSHPPRAEPAEANGSGSKSSAVANGYAVIEPEEEEIEEDDNEDVIDDAEELEEPESDAEMEEELEASLIGPEDAEASLGPEDAEPSLGPEEAEEDEEVEEEEGSDDASLPAATKADSEMITN